MDISKQQIPLPTPKRAPDLRRKRPEVFRWIPVSDSICADLAVYMLKLQPKIDANRNYESDFRPFPFTRQAAHKILSKAGKRAGLVARGGRDVSPHILRHSFAMNCLTQGVPITVVQESVGSASLP